MEKSNVLKDRRRRITRITMLITLGLLYLFLTFIFYFAAFFDFVSHSYTKIKFDTSPAIYYVDEFKPFLEGDLAYALFNKQNFLFMEKIGTSGRIYTAESWGNFDPSSQTAIVRFSEPGDHMFQTTVFYYKPAKEELILPGDLK